MSDEQKLQDVRDLEDFITQLKSVRNEVQGFSIDTYKDAGGATWAGQKRNQFTDGFETAKSSHSKISEQIDQAISDCKNKQRSLAFSIDFTKHPDYSIEAVATALS